MIKSPIVDKSKAFAVRIIRLCRYLIDERGEFILANQVLKSGASIGANIREAVYAQSKKDFTSKMSIALKECAETAYWLELLCETESISRLQFEDIYEDCRELLKILVSTVKTSKSKNNKQGDNDR